MGLAIKAASRWDEALGAFRASARLNPGDASAHYQAAMCLVRLNRRPETVAELRAALQIDPQHAESRQLLDALGAGT